MTPASLKLAIMQPYLFPYIGYFQLLHAVDRFVFYDDVHYIKGGWINRNRMLLGGRASYFSIPLAHASSHTLICETRIDRRQYDHAWGKLRKRFDQEYRRAPYFAPIRALIESVFAPHADTIAELAMRSVRATAQLLGLEAGREAVRSSERYADRTRTGQDRILDICRHERATQYVNLPGGRALYRPEEFRSRGVELRFVDSAELRYEQSGGEFVPMLSILDVLMFNGPHDTNRLIRRYRLSGA